MTNPDSFSEEFRVYPGPGSDTVGDRWALRSATTTTFSFRYPMKSYYTY